MLIQNFYVIVYTYDVVSLLLIFKNANVSSGEIDLESNP